MRSRLRRLAGSGLLDELDPSGERRAAVTAGEPTISTYHAYAGRLVGEHMRSMGLPTSGPPPFGPRDRSAFLQALDTAVVRARRSLP
ncbi:MAG: DUF188 domain-containing protein [Gemmatimonadales bacterium]|nr:DUF188 domain-containing protein [Gemmatimonadales bacterium]